MRALLATGTLVLGLAAAAAPAEARRAAHPHAAAPSLAASIAARLESGLDAVGGFEERCRDAGDWLLAGRDWLAELAAFQTRSGAVAAWVAATGSAADTLLGLLDPDGRLPRLDLEPYRIMTVQPVDGRHTSAFGFRMHPVLHRRMLHKGLDFRGDTGTPVHAAGAGVVVHASPWSTYGNIVIIDHGMGVETRYAHLSKIRVRVGDFVAAGALIGNVGATGRVTGPHLHFEVRYFDAPIDPERAFVEPEQTVVADQAPAGIGELIATWAPVRLLAR